MTQGVETQSLGHLPSLGTKTPASGHLWESGAMSQAQQLSEPASTAPLSVAETLRWSDWSSIQDMKTSALLNSCRMGEGALLNQPEGPPVMAIAGLLPPRGTKSLLVGPSGVGKTHLALELAACISEGRPFNGLELDPDQNGGAVLYLAAEDYDGVYWRLGALTGARHISAATQVIAANIAGFRLTDPADVDRIIAGMKALEDGLETYFDAVVVDHLTACAGESLDGDATAEAVMGALQRIATDKWVSVLALHHTGKDQSRGARGSQVLYDRADAVLQIREGRGGTRRLYVDKLRNGAKAADRFFRLSPLPGPYGGVRVEFLESEPQAAGPALTPRQSAALAALQSAGLTSGLTDAAAKAAIRLAPVFAALEGDTQRKAVQRALEDLEGAGQLERDGDVWNSPAEGGEDDSK